MKFRGTIFKGDQALLAGVFGEITGQGAAGGSPGWEGKFEVPAGDEIDPGQYQLLTDGGKSTDIEIINLVDQGPGRTRVAYFQCPTVPH